MANFHPLGNEVAQFALIASQSRNRQIRILAAQGQHETRGDRQIGRHAHLTDGDRHALQIGVVDLAPLQQLGHRAADQFPNAQLSLGGAVLALKFVLCHEGHVRGIRGLAKRQHVDVTEGHGMTDKPGIVITGGSGRMGQMLIAAVRASDACELVGVLEREGHDWVGQDIGIALGGAELGVVVSDDPVTTFAKAQAVIDFTSPEATVGFAELTAQARAVHVIGTTGLTEDDIAHLTAAARHAVIVRAGNMSLGVNLLAKLTQKVAAALDEDFDIEIIEAHHHHKVDAPSGTALMLGEAAAAGRGVMLKDVSDSGRDGITGARMRGDIGFSAIRGGDIVGEHDVLFAAAGERIKLTHIATDRAIFARGALKAALWGQDKKPGEYDMFDVLGLND